MEDVTQSVWVTLVVTRCWIFRTMHWKVKWSETSSRNQAHFTTANPFDWLTCHQIPSLLNEWAGEAEQNFFSFPSLPVVDWILRIYNLNVVALLLLLRRFELAIFARKHFIRKPRAATRPQCNEAAKKLKKVSMSVSFRFFLSGCCWLAQSCPLCRFFVINGQLVSLDSWLNSRGARLENASNDISDEAKS